MSQIYQPMQQHVHVLKLSLPLDVCRIVLFMRDCLRPPGTNDSFRLYVAITWGLLRRRCRGGNACWTPDTSAECKWLSVGDNGQSPTTQYNYSKLYNTLTQNFSKLSHSTECAAFDHTLHGRKHDNNGYMTSLPVEKTIKSHFMILIN